MIATIINLVSVLAGGLLGLLVKNNVSDEIKKHIFNGLGILTLIIGIQMAQQMTMILAFAISLIFGGIAGSLLGIENSILGLGEWMKKKLPKGTGESFATGFLDASVLFCAGAMTIIGSIQAGAYGDYSIILTKSVMDGTVAFFMASALGVGVVFSVVTIFAVQGSITMAAVYIAPYVSDLMSSQISGIGGALVMMIGINLLGLKKIKTGDFLPAMLFIVLFVILKQSFPGIPFL